MHTTSIDHPRPAALHRPRAGGGIPAPRWTIRAIAAACAGLFAACLPAPQDVQCVEDASCNRFTGGVCCAAPSGHRWCSYPDTACPSGYRYSDLDVGDGLSGKCTETPGLPRWVQQIGGMDGDFGNGVATDSAGNVIAVGTFSDSMQIGPATLTSVGQSDVFVMKLNGLTGELIWAKRFGGGGVDAGSAVRADDSGNLYVMGSFSQAVDFGGGELRSEGGEDLFVLKLSADGDHVWSRRFGGAGAERGHDLAVRGNAVAVVGEHTQPLSLGSSLQRQLGFPTTDVYIAMITSDGELRWSTSLGGPLWDRAFGAALDSSGDIVVVGVFAGTVNFGGGPLISANGNSDVFVVKYAGSTGAHLFSKRYGGPENDTASSVAVDAMDNIFIAGQFSGTVDLGGPTPLIAMVGGDIFVAKYTLAGAHLWARAFHAVSATNPGYQLPSSMAIEVDGEIVLAGHFCGTISFGGAEMSSASGCSATGGSSFPRDVFAVRLAGYDGAHLSSVRAASRAETSRSGVAADGRLYLVGHFDGFAQLGGRGLMPAGGADAFLLSLAPL